MGRMSRLKLTGTTAGALWASGDGFDAAASAIPKQGTATTTAQLPRPMRMRNSNRKWAPFDAWSVAWPQKSRRDMPAISQEVQEYLIWLRIS